MTLGVAFTDFWPGFEPQESAFAGALAEHGLPIVPPEEAAILFFSVYGKRRAHPSFVGTKVEYTAENSRPDFDAADFCIGFDHRRDERYLRLPYFAYLAITEPDALRLEVPGPAWSDREFCNFIYWHAGSPPRGELMARLSAVRAVTSPGRYLNNASAEELSDRYALDWRASKLRYQSRFRFTIACEGQSYPGYTTEKLYDALCAGTIPVYWGNPRVGDDFDSRAFVNCHDFDDLDAVVARVRELDADATAAAECLGHRDAMVKPAASYSAELSEFVGRIVEHAGQQRRSSAVRRAARLRLKQGAADEVLRARRIAHRLIRRT